MRKVISPPGRRPRRSPRRRQFDDDERESEVLLNPGLDDGKPHKAG